MPQCPLATLGGAIDEHRPEPTGLATIEASDHLMHEADCEYMRKCRMFLHPNSLQKVNQ